jgi:transposase InsO family protein
VTVWAAECLKCQKGKVHRHVRLRPQHVAVPAQWFSHIHVDLVGPLPASEGATYVFTVIDRNTRWFEALLLDDISAKSCAGVLIQGWIARYWVPVVITSDWGSQFTLALWDSLCNILGIKHVQTTAQHPPGQQVGGALPPAAEGRPACAPGLSYVECPPALGPTCCPT